MSAWGPQMYGGPCTGCGYRWSLSANDAVALITGAQGAFRELLGSADGRERSPEPGWDVISYLSHVSDNLRVWAERLAAASLGAEQSITSYDSDALATARRYSELPLEGTLWLLGESAATWRRAWDATNGQAITLHHPERGQITPDDIARTNAHDVTHDLWDVRRCVEAGM